MDTGRIHSVNMGMDNNRKDLGGSVHVSELNSTNSRGRVRIDNTFY